ncbi:hypothetical protein ACF06W_11335 [Streptomyces albus]|uniref:hypothetical protein n=1 Tax=Streptomyces albus TaxID=1888 RepID=UPI0036F5BEA0
MELKSIFTRREAGQVYTAAWGAAHRAKAAGKKELADDLAALARTLRSIRRYGREVESASCHDVEPIRAAEVPPHFLALAREIASMGVWDGDSTLIGYVPRSGGGSRRLYASARGKRVAFSAETIALPEDQAPESPVPEVRATKMADMPDEARALVQTAKAQGLLGREWTPLGTVVQNGQDVQVFARLHGRAVRYGIAA